MSEDKRVHLRRALQTEGWLADMQESQWRNIDLLDISKGGAAFISPDNLPIESSQRFRFHLPGNPQLINFVVKITRCVEHPYFSGYRVGAQFMQIENKDLQAIEDFINDKAPVQYETQTA